jgi:hypothetical protein
MFRKLLLPILAATAVSCQQVSTEYEPRTALQPDAPSAFRAARFYDRDIPLIHAAGGRIVGNLYAHGSGASSFADVDDRALLDAAKAGGTHLIRTHKNVEAVFLKVSDARSDADCKTVGTIKGSAYAATSNCHTTFTDASYLKLAELPQAQYVVFHVPCENWRRLPEPLRPISYDSCEPSGEAAPQPVQAPPPPTEGPQPEEMSGVSVNEGCSVEPSRTGVPFVRSSGARAMRAGAERSLQCGWGDRVATVVLTFGPAGCLYRMNVEESEALGDAFTQCLVRSFSSVTVPAFSGGEVTVSKTFGAR